MEAAIPVLRPAPFLALIVPCYNEEDALPASIKTLGDLLDQLKSSGQVNERSVICYVDDGSTDSTWSLLEERCRVDPYCHAVKFAKNAGHQNALWAGMAEARHMRADCAISIDADLQDDTDAIPLMISQYCQGCDIVYGVRNDRESDSRFKRCSARLFYALMNRLDLTIIPDHADFRLVAAPVLAALERYGERGLFLRGLLPAMGFRSSIVQYRRLPRMAGSTKYPLRKMISLAWQGITSSSAAPLRIAGLMSLICMTLAIVLGLVYVGRWWAGSNMPGWTSLFIAILFLGSVQLFCLAVIGEYIAKIFTEVRHRPRYIIEKRI